MSMPAYRLRNGLRPTAHRVQRERQLSDRRTSEIRHRHQWLTRSPALPGGRTFVGSWSEARALATELESQGHQAEVDFEEVQP